MAAGAVVICSSGTAVGNQCVPDNCTGVDSNGLCTGCKSVIHEVVNGACALKTCPTGRALDSNGVCQVQCAAGQ